MAIQVPLETCYWYDVGRDFTRLVVCIPPGDLQREVSQKGVNRAILTDYPDGLDLEVSAHELTYFEEAYGLKIHVGPQELYDAFKVYYSGLKAPKPRTGFLPAALLEPAASEVSEALEAETPPKKLPRAPAKRIAAQSRFRSRRAEVVQKRLGRRSFREPPKVGFTEGEDAREVFLRALRGSIKGGR